MQCIIGRASQLRNIKECLFYLLVFFDQTHLWRKSIIASHQDRQTHLLLLTNQPGKGSQNDLLIVFWALTLQNHIAMTAPISVAKEH